MRKLYYLLLSMRPKQWTKNLIIFAAPIFSGKIFEKEFFIMSLMGFFLLSLISGSVYILNDLIDYSRDKNHPSKSIRPIASDKIKRSEAKGFFVLASILSLGGSYYLSKPFFFCTLGYFFLQVLYSVWLKNVVIVDVFSIATGFLLRALSGVYLLNLELSPWLFICAFLLALFLGFGKRRHEILTLNNSQDFRPVLGDYTKELLDALLVIVASATMVSYSLYTFFSETSEKHSGLMWSVPFVAYGLFRYLYLVYSKQLGGSPEDILISDIPLIIAIAGWLIVVAFVISRP